MKPGKRTAGVAAPVGGLRTGKSCGCGEYADLVELGAFAAERGLGLVQILPVNDSGWQGSPYSALSAFALHPVYARLDDVPEAAGKAREIAALRERLDAPGRFDYARVREAKLAFLRDVFDERSDPRSDELRAWIDANPWVRAYAAFLALKRRHGGRGWRDWGPDADAGPGAVDAAWNDADLFAETRFHAWLQMRLDAQLGAAAASLRAAGVALEGDIPILLNEDSTEVWSRREWFKLGFSAGAPPDMYARDGQNWGFPTYDWEAQERDGFAFWRTRLAVAERWFDAYRIDHVLGFFRIWSIPPRCDSGALGSFDPCADLDARALASAGFDAGRLSWLSRPHVRGEELRAALGHGAARFDEVVAACLRRIGDEDLYLFRDGIAGDRDLRQAALPDAARDFLLGQWKDRVLFERAPGRYVRSWEYEGTKAWRGLSGGERASLASLFERVARESEAIWENRGRKLLSVLVSSSRMLPCAEDLGAVPECVPRVLRELGVLGLRVVRWTRRWEEAGSPWVPLDEYPEETVCAASVHDTSTFRAWWRDEAEKGSFAALLRDGEGGDVVDPGTADLDAASQRRALAALSRARSRVFVAQLQDLVDMSGALRSADPASDRINVPGTNSATNWTWRMSAPIESLSRDPELAEGCRAIVGARDGGVTRTRDGRRG